MGSSTQPSSIRVFRNSIDEIPYTNDKVEGFWFNGATDTIELYGKYRPDVGDTYSIYTVVPTGDSNFQDGKLEVKLLHSAETYGTLDQNFQVLVDGEKVAYDDSKTNGYFYNSVTNTIELYGDTRPDAGKDTMDDVKVYYVTEIPGIVPHNESYDFRLASTTLDYGIASTSESKAIRVYQNDEEVPYSSESGFTYDPNTKILSLHGNELPTVEDGTGDFKVYSIEASDLQKVVPQNSYIYKVELNGLEINRTEDPSGNGYYYDGQKVEIVGNARPDVNNSKSNIDLAVQYFDSVEVSLNDNDFYNDFRHYCDHETDEEIAQAEIDPDSLQVKLNGKALSAEQYVLQDNKVVLNFKRLLPMLVLTAYLLIIGQDKALAIKIMTIRFKLELMPAKL